MKKLKRLWNHLKLIWNITEKTDDDYDRLFGYINHLEKKFGERTTVHADVGYRGQGSEVIVVGRYNGADYVRAFKVHHESLGQLIDLLRREEKYANVGKFDMMRGSIEFSAVYPYKEF